MEIADLLAPQDGFTLPWAEYDPGLLDGDGIAIRKCSTDFLASLYKACLDTYRPDEVNLPPADAKRLSECVVRELTRLMTHPDLFSTPTAYERFLYILEDSVSKVVEKRKQKQHQLTVDGFSIRANEIARREEQILQRINRPSFKPDLMPWEQFLFKGSPGSGVVLPPSPPNGYVQVMPIGGVALHLRWLRHTFMVAKECLESYGALSTSSKRTSRGSANKDSVFKAALYPTNIVTHQNTWITLTPNPYFEHRMPIPKHNRIIDRLESFNAIIERLEDEDLTDYNGERDGVRAMFYRTTVEDLPRIAE